PSTRVRSPAARSSTADSTLISRCSFHSAATDGRGGHRWPACPACRGRLPLSSSGVAAGAPPAGPRDAVTSLDAALAYAVDFVPPPGHRPVPQLLPIPVRGERQSQVEHLAVSSPARALRPAQHSPFLHDPAVGSDLVDHV